MKICDVHTHVLPGVDDGAPTMEYALQMLQNAVAGDVEMLAVTPHCNNIYNDGNYFDQSFKDRFLQLQKAAEELPIQLVTGAEVLVNDGLSAYLEQNMIPTINGGRYLLTEFFADTPKEEFLTSLKSILEFGYIPLVAHPERYDAVNQAPNIVTDWLDMGCHIQLTSGSILGEYGKKAQHTAAFLLKQELVACIASDAHGLHCRSNFMLDVYDHLRVQYSKQYAQCLLYDTPMRICCNDDI